MPFVPFTKHNQPSQARITSGKEWRRANPKRTDPRTPHHVNAQRRAQRRKLAQQK